jgi:hypothetical protein
VLEKSGNYLLHKDFYIQTAKTRNGFDENLVVKFEGGRVASKGTWRARVGSNRSPYGKVGCNFDQTKNRCFKIKKERRLVLQTLLYNKKIIS